MHRHMVPLSTGQNNGADWVKLRGSMNTIDLFINSLEFHYRMFSCFLLQDGKDYINITKLAVDIWLYTGQRYL